MISMLYQLEIYGIDDSQSRKEMPTLIDSAQRKIILIAAIDFLRTGSQKQPEI